MLVMASGVDYGFANESTVHNDFHETHGIFKVFEGLEVKDMDKTVEISKDLIDAPTEQHLSNGTNGINGTNGVHSVDEKTNGEKGAQNGLLANGVAKVAQLATS
jgi:hypothetical protein